MRFRELAVFSTASLVGLTLARPLEYAKMGIVPARRDLLGLLGDIKAGEAGPETVQGGVETTSLLASATTVLPVGLTNGDVGTMRGIPAAPTALALGVTGQALVQSTRSKSMSVNLVNPLSTPHITLAGTASTMVDADHPAESSEPASAASAMESSPPGYISSLGSAEEEEAPDTPPGELAEWKVIGIAVITIAGIATAVLAVSFFDAWWGFLCAAVCGRKVSQKFRKGNSGGKGKEMLVPDWKRRSWEMRLAGEDGHRYPTMSSLESIVREKEKGRALDLRRAGLDGEDVALPELAYPYGAP